MNRLILITSLIYVVPAFSQFYSITTTAGTDRVLNGSSATTVPLRTPTSVVIDDAGNLYIADRSDARIRKVTAAGVISTYAGTGVPGLSGDRGPAAQAQIDLPGGLSLDGAGNLYFADRNNNRVRRISADGTINTVAGNGGRGSDGDGGLATAARMRPSYVAADRLGNLYIFEGPSFRLRKVDAKGVITTIAGSGSPGYSGDNGPAAGATFGVAGGLAVDAKGNVYISDLSAAVVRRIDTSGMIIPFAGSGQSGFINDGVAATQELMLPTGIAFDAAGNTYISDVNLSRIIKIDTANKASTVAGNRTTGFSGDNGPALQAEFNLPDGLAVDSTGAIFVADRLNNRVRKVSSGVIVTVAGTAIRDGGPAANAFLNSPEGIALAAPGQLAVADSSNGAVRKFTVGGAINSVGQLAGSPSGVAYDGFGNLFVSDDEPYVLKITPGGVTSFAAGSGVAGFSGDGGIASGAKLNGPDGLALDAAGNLYIADFDNERVRKVNASTQIITTIAGTGAVKAAGDGGPAMAAALDPVDLAFDAKGNLFIADFLNDRVRKIAVDGTITTVAGNGKTGYDGDGGPATLASLDGPSGIAFDTAGNLYIADSLNAVVRRVNPVGLITTIAGNGTPFPTIGDGGAALNAQLEPWRLAVDTNGVIYVSDLLNDRVRALTPKISTATALALVSGNNQTLNPGVDGQTLVVKLVDATGGPVFGSTVTFVVNPAAAATVAFPQAATLSDGMVRMKLTAGTTLGTFTVSASVSGLAPVMFNATVVPVISPTAPRITVGGIVSAGLSVPAVKALSANSIATIFGANFAVAGTARQVGLDDLVDGRVPLQLAGVCVQVGNARAPIFSVYPGQINFQVPSVVSGSVNIQVLTKCGTAQEEKSGLEPVAMRAASPEFFYFLQSASGRNPIAALNSITGAYVGQPGLIAGLAFTPAQPRDYLTLFATGFGATSPGFAAGELPGAAGQATGPVSVTVGGVPVDPADILYAGVTSNAGLYQLNIRLPEILADGDLPVIVTISGVPSPSGAYVTVKN